MTTIRRLWCKLVGHAAEIVAVPRGDGMQMLATVCSRCGDPIPPKRRVRGRGRVH